MFTKMYAPVTQSYFLDSGTGTGLGEINRGVVTLKGDRSWLALGLVFCAHLTAFAALRPQPEALPLVTAPEPIMVSLLSAQQAAPQTPQPPAKPITKAHKPVKPARALRKTPINKPVVPQHASVSDSPPPVEQSAIPETTTSPPIAVQTSATTAKTVEAQAYQPASFNAAYLQNPAPAYPSISRRLGEQGKVLLSVQVTADGVAGSVELQTSSGSTRLDQAALEAVKKWRFVPAKRGGQAASASVIVPVRFSIEG